MLRLILKSIVTGLIISTLIGCSNQNYKSCGNESIYCGISLVNLIVEPNKYDNKIVSLQGYFHIAGRGPFQGYWLSMDEEHLDFNNSVKILIPNDAPQLNWIQDGEYYRVVGIFKNCNKINCRPEIIQYDKDPRIVVPAT